MIDLHIINLKKRSDKLDKIKVDFIDYNLIIIEAIEDKEGWVGCFNSHIKCIKKAKEFNLPYIIVVEDDCKIINKTTFNSNLCKILNWLENNMEKWNIFLGGVTNVWNYNKMIKLDNNLKLLNISEGKTAHFTIYNSNSYDFYLNLKPNIPIDKCWHNKLISFVSIPFITTQYSGYSDIENKKVNYDLRFVDVEKKLINLINNTYVKYHNIMNKLIILTPSIIRGEFHVKSIGKFYDFFYKYFKSKYEIYHIINIDEPVNLKKYFNKYETIDIYNKIIPPDVNKIYITEPNPGFLQAWKKIVLKIEKLGLINDLYLYYWLEDDWEPKVSYNILNFFELFNFSNTAYAICDKAPLGSFRGGPFMTGHYFSNIFNIRKYMNETCDPERQMQRWLRGGYQKNGNSFIHRLNVLNPNISNEIIHIIIVCEETNICIDDLNKYHYKTNFDKSIEFKYHLITYDNEKKNLKYSLVDNSANFKLVDIDCNELNTIFDNNYIKYFILKPSIQFDIGRDFNKEFGLQKWMKIEDNTSYSNVKFYNANIGNDFGLSEEELRLNTNITLNNNFINDFGIIVKCLPYLEENYFNKETKLNFNYYSHIYGGYPNFQVFGNLIHFNYTPTSNDKNLKFDELECLSKIYGENKYIPNIKDLEIIQKYFAFDKNIMDEVDNYIFKNFGKKTLGVYGFSNNADEINNKLNNIINEYDCVFISNSKINSIDKIKGINTIYYLENKTEPNERLNKINDIINKIKINFNNVDELVDLEKQLKCETKNNKLFLKSCIINFLILLNCKNILHL